MTIEEIKSTQIVEKQYENIAKPLAVAILDRAIRDCVSLRKKDMRHFINPTCILTETKQKILSKEKKRMVQFFESEKFLVLCEIIGQKDDVVRTRILNILKNNDAAIQAAKVLGMKFVCPIFLAIALTLIPAPIHSQPFAPLRPFILLPIDKSVVEVTTLDSVHAIKIPVKCHGRTIMYRVATYTYLTPSGTKVNYPFLVQGSDKAKHPVTAKIKVVGKKLMLFAPFIEVAGAIAQILILFKI